MREARAIAQNLHLDILNKMGPAPRANMILVIAIGVALGLTLYYHFSTVVELIAVYLTVVGALAIIVAIWRPVLLMLATLAIIILPVYAFAATLRLLHGVESLGQYVPLVLGCGAFLFVAVIFIAWHYENPDKHNIGLPWARRWAFIRRRQLDKRCREAVRRALNGPAWDSEFFDD
jgi:hypothetical protein